MEELIRPIEYAIASFAADYAEAGNQLNPFLDAEVHSLGAAQLVYSGQVSKVHGGFGLALEGELSSSDHQEIDEFFFRMQRDPDFYTCPLTDKHTIQYWQKQGFKLANQEVVHWHDLQNLPGEKEASISNTPDHGEWVQKFGATLFASTMMYMRNTRFFMSANEASFLYFHQKWAFSFCPKLPSSTMLQTMLHFAKEFQSKGVCLVLPIAETSPPLFQKLYTRDCLSKQKDLP
jgi:hypothetical protein